LVVQTLKANTITWWDDDGGLKRGWFKTAKHRFGLPGQNYLEGFIVVVLS